MKIHLHDMEAGIICGEDGLAIADCNVAPRIEEKVKANAAFIVKAVNSHEELLKAAKLALLELEMIDKSNQESNAMYDLKVAIAKAEGGK